jgi:Ca2+-binding RTX toxin-like protein
LSSPYLVTGAKIMAFSFGPLRELVRKSNRHAKRTQQKRRLRLETLENRRLLASINWVNEGADDFGVVFGAQAAAARSVVHAAIDDWESVIANFNNANANTYNLYLRMATQADVDNYGFGGGSINVIAGQAPPSAITVVAGKPIQGLVLLGRGPDGLGTDYFIDPTPNEHSEFQGDIVNAFHGQASAPAAVSQTDLYSLVQAELTHALGITSAPNSAYRELIDAGPGGIGGVSLTDTGVLDATALGTGATLWAFDGPSINYLMTDVDGNSKRFPAHTARPHVTHGVLVDNEVVRGNTNLGNAAFNSGARYLISNAVALMLQDTYGYTLAAGGPERQATLYAIQDASGDVNVRGQTGNSNDSIILNSQVAYVQAAVNPGIDVPGTAPFANGSSFFMTRFLPATVDDIRVNAGEGNDSVLALGAYAGIGLVQLNGDAGNDTLNASFVNAHVIFENGGDGNDILRGGGLNDVLVGGNGNDQLYGNAGQDSLFGNVGNDRLYGGDGNDMLFGNEGNDELHGNSGNDQLDGGSQNDELYGEDGDDQLRGQTGDDHLYGGNGNDLIWGHDGNDYLHGENDHDQLFAGPGNDVGYGNSGNDILLGDLGNDRLEGGVGNDNINGNLGNDILIGGSTLAAINLFAVDGLDVIGGNEGDDLIIGDNAFGNLPAPSGGAADTLRGGDGDDRIYGGIGADQIWGDAGNDLLIGMWGADEMFGGAGNDEMRGSEDNDLMRGDDGDDVMQGDDGSDTLFGGIGNDLLRGNDGNDLLRGEAGNDILLGGDGRDELLAGDGRDLMIGGLHGDRLVGDAGEDILIAGTTTHDANDVALQAILAEWTSLRTYNQRVMNLRSQANATFAMRANGNRFLRAGIEVQADAGGNVLNGLADRDWFFISPGDLTDALLIERVN